MLAITVFRSKSRSFRPKELLAVGAGLVVVSSGLTVVGPANSASPQASTPTTAAVSASSVPLALSAMPSAASKRGTLRGRIKKQNGKPLKGIWVYAFRKKTRPGVGREAGRTRTDALGKYRFTGLKIGRYRVLADGFPKLRSAGWVGGVVPWRQADRIKVKKRKSVKARAIRLGKLPVVPSDKPVPTRSPKSPATISGVPVDEWQSYSGQSECKNETQPGTLSVKDLLTTTYGNEFAIGLNRICGSDKSEHYDGRAIDWMVDSRQLYSGVKGDAFVNWLTKVRGGEIGAMARRLGIMYVIWRGRSWAQYRPDGSWNEYLDCQSKAKRGREHDNICHRNHVHLSLTPEGAQQQTSWWTGLAWS